MVVEMQAETQFKENLCFLASEGRYQTTLIWKNEDRPTSNYAKAKRMFLSLEKSLEVSEAKRHAFHDLHHQWLAAGYLEEAEDDPEEKDQFFLPGFLVERETTHGLTYRFAMNGAKEFGGRSLNNFLLPGPNRMNNLADVLIRFRRHPFVLTCDIQHMFLGILVAPVDRDYLRIFYQSGPHEEICVLRCTRHVFGLCCSPFVAMSTVLYHAQKKAYQLPLAYHLVRYHIIVDDILASFAEINEVVCAKKELHQLFEGMGLKPHKWASNCSKS